MRSRISEKNIFPNFSLEQEYEKLHDLFFDGSAFGKIQYVTQRISPCYSYNDCLSGMFLDWELRGTFTSLEEMELALKISEDDFSKSVTEERLLDYIQFVLNAVVFVTGKAKNYSIHPVGSTIFNAIADNSHCIIERLGAELKTDKGTGEFFIIYKDDVATAIAEQNEELEPSIVEYLKIDNRHDLTRKGEVLCTLAKKLEPYEKKLCGTEFKSLCKDTTFLLNNIGARHYQNPNSKIGTRLTGMSEVDLESWYDKAFQLVIACMSVLPYLDSKADIDKLKG